MEATAATLERRVRVIPATRKTEELHRDHDGKSARSGLLPCLDG